MEKTNNKPKIIFMPHANIQYSQLHPDKREWVIRNAYEPLFKLIAKNDYRIGFEASGATLDVIADKCPDVLADLKELIQLEKIEPVGSPHIHIMLPNVDRVIGLNSLKHGLDTWEKHTGVRPEVGWNPECGWADFLPDIYLEAGFKALVMDADSFLLSFEEIRKATGLKYDVRGHSNKNHLFKIEEYIKDKPQFLRYVTNPSISPNGLKMIFRSDFMANPMLWFLMGATEGMRKEPVSSDEIRNMLKNWKKRIQKTGTFIMPYAEDAEYIGTSAYFYVKQFNQARFFESEPESVTRFKQLLDLAKETGYELSTPSNVIADSTETILNKDIMAIENGAAWHGGTAKAWANTRYSRIIDPVCQSIFNGIKSVAEHTGTSLNTPEGALDDALKLLTSAYVSDARWPPLPTTPGRFNVEESISDLRAANESMRRAMEKHGISELKSLYSPDLMETQINCIEETLMDMKYFAEE